MTVSQAAGSRTRQHRALRAALRGSASALAVAALVLALPAAAGAHAYLVSETPASGAVVQASPHKVTLVYDEPVTTGAGALGVFDATGAHVDSGHVLHPSGTTIAVAIPHALPHGTYTVAWRVTSADTHVVHGAFTFSVGAPGKAGGVAAKLSAQNGIPPGISDGFAVVRFLNFLLLLLCGGGAVTLVLVLRDADSRLRRRLSRLLVVCAGLLALVAVLGLPFEAAEANGTGLGGGFHAAAVAGVRDLRFGQVWLARGWLALLFALLALSLERGRPGRLHLREAALVAVGVVLLLTPSASGHANVSGPLTFAVDALHVVMAAMWVGGLAFVVAGLALSPAELRWPLAARSVPRFSALAVGSVALLVAAGAANAYLEVRAWRGLWQSTYGNLVLAKAALALPLLALGAFNNRVTVPRLRDGIASVLVRRRFLRAVAGELVVLVAVVGVTAVLVSEAPAKNEVAQTASRTSSVRIGPYDGTIRISPARAGTNTIDLSFATASGKPARLAEVDVAASLPGRDVGPLRFKARRRAPGSFRVSGASLPIAGDWKVRVTVRHGQIDEWLKTTTIQIGKDGTP